MESKTCCFVGPRTLPPGIIERITVRLNEEMEALIRQGVTHYLSGGARGFDLVAAALVVAKREMGSDLHLHFILPYREYDALWPEREKKLSHDLLSEADTVQYIKDSFRVGCVRNHSRYLVGHSEYCIYAPAGGGRDISQAVRYAGRQGVRLISVAG